MPAAPAPMMATFFRGDADAMANWCFHLFMVEKRMQSEEM